MQFEEFVSLSVLPEIQVTSMHFKPNIPQDKLANALREYAPNVGMSSVTVLIDETFWGNAKEGLIITNKAIHLSKKLGGRTFDLVSISEIRIDEKHLIINDHPVAKLNNPEVMPCAALGSTLDQFIQLTKKAAQSAPSSGALSDDDIQKLITFVARFSGPRFFDSATSKERERRKTPGFELPSGLTEQQLRLIGFKCGFATNERLVCSAGLESHGRHDYFFCITNCGAYSVRPGRLTVYISHNNLRALTPIEEYEDGRYVAVRLSNGEGVVVSIQNVAVRPYGLDLFSGLIDILNSRDVSREIPTSRQSANGPLISENSQVFGASHPRLATASTGVVTTDLLNRAYEVMSSEILKGETDAEMCEWIFGGFKRVHRLVANPNAVQRLRSELSRGSSDELEFSAILICVLYIHAISKLPNGPRYVLGENWTGILSLANLFIEALAAECIDSDTPFGLDEEVTMLLHILFSGASEEHRPNFMRELFDNAGVQDSEGLVLMFLEKMGVRPAVVRHAMTQAESEVNAWVREVSDED